MPEIANPSVGRLQDVAGNGINSVVANADMVVTDRLLDVGALLYGYDDTAGKPVSVSTARNQAAANSGARLLPVVKYRHNGVSFDPEMNNREGTLLASAARTANVSSAAQINYNSRGVAVYLEISAASGTGGLQLFIESLDPITGSWTQINATPAAIITASRFRFTVYPGASGGSVQQVTAEPLPRSWRVSIVVGDASAYTYSVSFATIV